MESSEPAKEGFPWDLRAAWQVCALALTVCTCLCIHCAAYAFRVQKHVCCLSFPTSADICLCQFVSVTVVWAHGSVFLWQPYWIYISATSEDMLGELRCIYETIIPQLQIDGNKKRVRL